MTEVIKNISMKNETGTDLVVDSIIGADAPYITVFQSTTGEEEVCEEKVKKFELDKDRIKLKS